MKKYAPLFRAGAVMTYVTAFLIGSIYAQMIPTLSLYLVKRYGSTPIEIGLFFVVLSVGTIAVSQVIGVLSDRGMNRLILVCGGLFAGAAACLCFALSPSYWIALGLGVIAFSFAGITLPQINALGREYADETIEPEHIPLYNAVLRATFALSWVGGPPLGFILQHALGATSHYLWLAVAHGVVGFLAWFFLPRVKIKKQQPIAPLDERNATTPSIPTNLKIAFIACAILFGVNQSYIIALPLYLNEYLGIASHLTGYIMGTAAALEIPIMIMGGILAAKISLLPLIRVGALGAFLLYLGIWLSSGLWHIIALQVFNAIFVGFVAGLGMTWYQDQMPSLTGTASSLFNNAINTGNVLGSLIIGIIAAWIGYHHMYAANAMFALVALALLAICKDHTKSL